MYHQLSAWLLHGILIDKRGEFFIKEVTSTDDQTVDKTAEGAGTSSNDLGIPGITGRQLTEILVRAAANLSYTHLIVEQSVILGKWENNNIMQERSTHAL